MRTLLFIFCSLLLTSCASTVRMKYEATIVDDMFNTAQFEYYKTYKDKKPSQEELAKDANRKLAEIFGENNFQHNNIKMSTYGSSDLPEDYNFPTGKPLVNNSPFTYQERYPEKKSSKSSSKE